MKGRTNEEGSDPATDKRADDAGRRGQLERQGGESRSEAETPAAGSPQGGRRPATMEPLENEP